jgi:hypothetical protein
MSDMNFMDYRQAMKVVYRYVCLEDTLDYIANTSKDHPFYNTRSKVTECVQKYGFTTSNKNKGYGSTGVDCGRFRGMSLEEFFEHMEGHTGKDGDDFEKKVEQDKASKSQFNHQQPQKLKQLQQSPKPHVNTTAYTTRDASPKSKVTMGGICAVAIIILGIFLFRSVIGGGNPLNSKNALNEIQHFIPTQLSGLTVGEMFDGACSDGTWSTYEVDDNKGLFSAAVTWARFSGNSQRGEINATFTITKKRMLDYTCFVDGKPIEFEELYRMFHDPNYDKDLSATAEAAENEAKFDAAEEKINKMNLVHNYVVDDFKGMTILKFTDSVCTSGDWSMNDKGENLRVVFEGQSEKGKVQAIFDVDEKLGTVKASWYFYSREIAATDLYQKFYPQK